VRLRIVGLRDDTGGSLGTQPTRYGDGISLYAVQFEPNRVLAFYIAFALWLFGLYVWRRVDRSMDRYALDAASQDEDAAASVRARSDDLRPAADPVHHLHAQGHPRHPPRLVAAVAGVCRCPPPPGLAP
jgi:hypothetical protein